MSESSVPVFVLPTSLVFYASDISSHKQVLTLYNPYDFAVRFQVLCSSREKNKYSVVDPEGSINARCCVDIVIRHNGIIASNYGQTDTFRIQMFQFSTNQVIGKKDVVAELLAGDRSIETFQSLPASTGSPPIQYPPQRRQVRPGAPNSMVVVAAVLCAGTLLLPTQGEASSFLPDYLKPSVNLKLCAAFLLGLVTMVLFRPE